MSEPSFRKLELSISVAAPAEAVWNALTTGEGLAAWYVSEASVEPGLGGDVTISFGGGPPGRSTIDVWEPPTRVRFAYVPEGGMEIGDMPGGSEEWLLTHEHGTTTIRLVHSLPDPGVDDWEGYYGDIARGWRLFLATLRHYLESTPRRGRVTTLAVPPAADEPARVWDRLQAELGIEPPAAGATTAVTVDGARVPARVLEAVPPFGMVLDVGGTLLFADIEGSGANRVVYALASTFGPDSPEDRALRVALVAAAERAAG